MPLEIRAKKNNAPTLERALRSRARDSEHVELTAREEDARVSGLLKKQDWSFQPGHGMNQPLSSNRQREFLRDSRFFVHLHNLELNELEKEADQFLRKNLSSIQHIQKDLDAVDASVVEEEIRFYKEYDQVHYNGFIRERDMPLDQQSGDWMVDPRTGSSFERHQLLHVLPSTGLTLPIASRLRVPVVDAHLVSEETDVGDTREPIVASDPRDVFLPNKVFRWVIIRREHDETTRIYRRGDSTVTFLLDLPGLQLINHLDVTPASASSLLVDEISYINEANEEIVLSALRVDSRGGLSFQFEPIRARHVKIRFIQYAPVLKLGRDQQDLELRELNKLLAGLDWYGRFSAPTEYIEGRVFDFSIRDIRVGLNTYLPTGVFRSKPVHVRNLASAIVTDAIEQVPITQGPNSGDPDVLPDVEAFSEYYLGLDIKSKQGKRLIKDLVPIPDSYPIQVEFLPLVGSDGQLKLMPDLTWNLVTNRVLTGTAGSQRRLTVTTEEPHGFAVGDQVAFLAPAGHPLVDGQYEVKTVTGVYAFAIQTPGLAVESVITANTTPYVKVYKYEPTVVNTQSPPIRVFQDGVELFIGDDYLLNFGTTTTWLSAFPTGLELQQVLEDARSGRCHIRMTFPDFTSVYWVEYRPLANQWLGITKLARLRNGRVVFDSRFRHSSGTISTVAILRGDFTNPHNSPLVRNYALKLHSFGKRL